MGDPFSNPPWKPGELPRGFEPAAVALAGVPMIAIDRPLAFWQQYSLAIFAREYQISTLVDVIAEP